MSRSTADDAPGNRRPDPPPLGAPSPVLGAAALAFSAALAVRALHLAQIRAAPFYGLKMGDARVYHDWAREIVSGDWLGHGAFYKAPLYPYLLGGTYALLGESTTAVLAVQALVGATSCALLAAAGARLFGVGAGLAAGLLLALYPPLVFADGLIQKSGLAVFLVCALLWLLTEATRRPAARVWAALGACIGALVLVRENALVWLPLLAATAATAAGAEGRRARFAAALGLGAAVVLFPVGVRNLAVGGTFHLTATNAGPNLYIGNHAGADGLYQALRPGHASPRYERIDAREIAEAEMGRPLGDGEVSLYWCRRAGDWMRGHPADFARLLARKAALFANAAEVGNTEDQRAYTSFSWPLRAIAPWLHFGVLLPAGLFGVAATARRWRVLWPLHALGVAYAASVVLFFVFARFRLPLVPLLALFAAGGLAELPELVHRPRHAAAALALALAAAVAANWPLETRSGGPFTTLNTAAALLADGRAAEAIAPFRDVLLVAPDWPEAHHGLAQALLRTGDLEGAVHHYRRAVALQPDARTYREGARAAATALERVAVARRAAGRAAQAERAAAAARALAELAGPS